MAPLFEYVSQTIGIVLIYDSTSNCAVWNVTCKLDFPIIQIYEPLNYFASSTILLPYQITHSPRSWKYWSTFFPGQMSVCWNRRNVVQKTHFRCLTTIFYVGPTFYFRRVITILCLCIMLAYSETTRMASKWVGDGDKSWWGEDRQDVQGI